MLLPALSKAKEKAKKIYCYNNLKQMGLAMIMYADDNKGLIPRGNAPHWWQLYIPCGWQKLRHGTKSLILLDLSSS
jgi:hypothetical protein